MIVSQDWVGRQSGWGFSERHDPVREAYTQTSALQRHRNTSLDYMFTYKLLTSKIPRSVVTLNKLCGLVRSKKNILNSGGH